MDHAAAAIVEFLNLAKELPSGTFVSVPAKIAHEVIDGYKLANRNRRGAASLVQHTCDLMAPVLRAATSHSKEELGGALMEELDALPNLLGEVQRGMLHITGRGTLSKFMKRSDDKQLINDLNNKLVQRLRTFEMKGLLNIQIRQNVNEQARRDDHAVLQRNQVEILARLDPSRGTTATVTRARASPLRQAISPHFTGRGDLVARSIAAITGSSRPHLSFFGTGGVGKTSMALAVAHHETCVQRFGDNRYFVECELLTSASAVRSSILTALAGSAPVPSQGDPRDLLSDMLSVDHQVLLILDNFESPWDVDGQRTELIELLKELAAMLNVRLITTLRSDDAPAAGAVAWTAIPVQVLPLDAARDLFLSISRSTDQTEHNDLDRLLNEVGCLPLAVQLLAELKKNQTCSELLRRWQDRKTALVKTERRGGTRLTSLDVSVSLSLQSPLLDDAARKLLATICLMPAGVIGGRQKLKAMGLGLADVDEKLDALLEVALLTDDRTTHRITTLPPIRTYVSSQSFSACEQRLEMYYITDIKHWDDLSLGDADHLERQDGLLAEADNIRHFFEHRMTYHPSLLLGQAIFAFAYLEYSLRPSTQLIICLINHLGHIGWEEQRPRCVKRLADIYGIQRNYTEAEQKLRLAHTQFVEVGDKLGAAQCLHSLAQAHTMLNKYTEAERELLAAQVQFDEVGSRLGIAQCLQSLGQIHRMLNRYTEAEQEIRLAQAHFNDVGGRLGAAQCLLSLADVHSMLSKYTEAEQELQLAQMQFVEIGDRLGAARCLIRLADVHIMFSKYTEAEQELRTAQAQFVELGDKLGAAQCLKSLANIHSLLSNYTEAEQELQSAHAQFVELRDRHRAAQSLLHLAEVHSMLSKYTEAEQDLREAQAQFIELKYELGIAQCLRSLARLHGMQRNYTEAEQELRSAQAQFVEIGSRLDVVQCLSSLLEIFCRQQRWQEFETVLVEAESIADSIGNRYLQACMFQFRGRLYKVQKRYDEALFQCTRSRDLFLLIGRTADAQDVMQEPVD